MWNASPRAAGLMVLEISHRINSASTAASAMVVEKATADTRLIGGLDGRRPRLKTENHRAWLSPSKGDDFSRPWSEVWPERMGTIFWSTTVDTRRKVSKKGREANATAARACFLPPGVHSSQSLVGGTIDAFLLARS